MKRKILVSVIALAMLTSCCLSGCDSSSSASSTVVGKSSEVTESTEKTDST